MIGHLYSLACLLCVIGTVVWLGRHRRTCSLLQSSYWRFLAQPWKLITFATALGAFTFMAPYTGDPTWDYATASFMSVLTFATAPWAVATFYLALRRRRPAIEAVVAASVMLFADSWLYDAYLFITNGWYAPTRWSNLVLSTIIYLSAGMFWNLDSRPGRGTIFAFMASPWPDATRRPLSATQLLWMMLFILPIALLFLLFPYLEREYWW